MASDRHNRQAGLLEHYRRTLPYSADIRDVPTHEYLGARFWSNNTVSLLPAFQQLVEETVGGGTRGWLFAPPTPQDPVPPAHYMRADVVITKKAAPGTATGFVYNISLQRDGNGFETSYIIRTGTIFPDPADPLRRWVCEEIIFAVSKDDLNYQSQGDFSGTALQVFANFRSTGTPKLVGWTMYSVPADSRHFPDGPGEPPVRPDQPVVYTLTSAAGPYRDATNLVLTYDELSSEREIAIIRGVV